MSIKSELNLIYEQDTMRHSQEGGLLFSIFDGERNITEEMYKEVWQFVDHVAALEAVKNAQK